MKYNKFSRFNYIIVLVISIALLLVFPSLVFGTEVSVNDDIEVKNEERNMNTLQHNINEVIDDNEPAGVSVTEVAFPDVPVEHWAYREIRELVDCGIINGFPDGKFKPSDSLNREQFAAMLVRAMSTDSEIIERNQQTTPVFSDMPADYWATPYAEAVKDLFSVYETENGLEFRGKNDAVREIVVSALVKAVGYREKPEINILVENFYDYEEISPDLRDDVALALQKKLVNGFPDGTFRPKGKLNRAQAAVLIYRAFFSDLSKVSITDLPPLTDSEEKYGKLKEILNNKFGFMVINDGKQDKEFKFTFNIKDMKFNVPNKITYVYMNLGMDGQQEQYFRFLPVFEKNEDFILDYMKNIAREVEKNSGMENIIVNMGFYRNYFYNVAGIFGNDIVVFNPDLNVYEVKQSFVSILYSENTVVKRNVNAMLVKM